MPRKCKRDFANDSCGLSRGIPPFHAGGTWAEHEISRTGQYHAIQNESIPCQASGDDRCLGLALMPGAECWRSAVPGSGSEVVG